MKKFLALTVLSLVTSGAANAASYYITIKNGSAMPLSPGVLYAREGQNNANGAQIGQPPSPGFIKICQEGKTEIRAQELAMDMTVKSIVQTMNPILPGESATFEIQVPNPQVQSIQFETMYAKTKDACANATVGGHSLYALQQHVTTEFVGKDNAVLTGAFSDPVMPAAPYPTTTCNNAMNAVSCLRELSVPIAGKAQVKYFSSYLPSLLTFLEMKYGSADVQTLLFPTSGAVQIQAKLKH